jgi:hypothetical protein
MLASNLRETDMAIDASGGAMLFSAGQIEWKEK